MNAERKLNFDTDLHPLDEAHQHLSGAERSGVPQGCPSSATGSTETLAVERGETEVNRKPKQGKVADSLVRSTEKAVRALVEIWRKRAKRNKSIAERHLWEGNKDGAFSANLRATGFAFCARELETALQPGAGQRSAQRAFPSNAELCHRDEPVASTTTQQR